jgi:micrococcal nuclease
MLAWVADSWAARFGAKKAKAVPSTFVQVSSAPPPPPPPPPPLSCSFPPSLDLDLDLDLDSATKDNCAWFGVPMDEVLECKVVDVYDGDTITVVLPFCGRLFKSKCRLLGIDSPEIRTKDLIEKGAAQAARDWLRRQILDRRVYLRCKGYDKYGRLLADVYQQEGCFPPSLNTLMITNGYAVAYDGGTKKAFVAAPEDVST